MPKPLPPSKTEPRHTLSVEVGNWFKANATGGGVLAIPAILVILALVALAQGWIGFS